MSPSVTLNTKTTSKFERCHVLIGCFSPVISGTIAKKKNKNKNKTTTTTQMQFLHTVAFVKRSALVLLDLLQNIFTEVQGSTKHLPGWTQLNSNKEKIIG